MENTEIIRCNYCGKEKVKVASECCEECNWEMYRNEIYELIAIDEENTNTENKIDKNPLKNPYLLENYTKYEIARNFASKQHIQEFYHLEPDYI
ncbi:hypothetical protein FOA22_03275 [Heyndrickxia oleronia]|uniref:hypothetical protein n=1 Tax=Heyndrickxia oleronia TaxID=38875 RepID=UPI0007174428